MKTDQQQAAEHTSNEALASLPPAHGSASLRELAYKALRLVEYRTTPHEVVDACRALASAEDEIVRVRSENSRLFALLCAARENGIASTGFDSVIAWRIARDVDALSKPNT